MLSLLRQVLERMTAMLVTAAVHEVEVAILTRRAEWFSEMARLAAGYESAGDSASAWSLRHETVEVDPKSSISGKLPLMGVDPTRPAEASGSSSSQPKVRTSSRNQPR